MDSPTNKKYLSEIFRTAAAYELFLRLASEKSTLVTAALEAEMKHFLLCPFNGRRKKRKATKEKEND
jgi:hypothetical protein